MVIPATTKSKIYPKVIHLYATNSFTTNTTIQMQAMLAKNSQDVSKAMLMTMMAKMGSLRMMRSMLRFTRYRLVCFQGSSKSGRVLSRRENQLLIGSFLGLSVGLEIVLSDFRTGLGPNAVLLDFIVLTIYLGDNCCYFFLSGNRLSSIVSVGY